MEFTKEQLQVKFEELKELKQGNLTEKLLCLGFLYSGTVSEIKTVDEFIAVINDSKILKASHLAAYFGEYLEYHDIVQMLKVGEKGFTENEILNAFKIISCTPTTSVSTEEFVESLYK
ncbi:hypothetical protein NUSPORA_01302 [Nucleospora cyclopteri]